MKRMLLATSASLAALLCASAAGQTTVAPAANDVIGIWRNPKGSVYVRTELCGDRLCGEIVCATARATAKARAKGAETLVGTTVLESYRPRKDGSWKGKVFVPDRQSRFDSTLTPIPPDRLQIRGCMLAGLICKEQIWRRAKTAACEETI